MSVLRKSLSDRYPWPEFVTLFEVRNGTGFVRSARTADAVVMGTWPSRGMDLQGFEFKDHRSDWLREKANPAKADDMACWFDRFWLVAAAGVAKIEEVPSTWGFLVLGAKGRLVCEREAPEMHSEHRARPVDRLMLASLLRAAYGQSWRAATIAEEVNTTVEARLGEERERWEKECARLGEERDAERRRILAFECAAGVSVGNFSQWSKRSPEDMGRTVRFVLDGGLKTIGKKLAEVERRCAALSADAASVRALLEGGD